MSHRRKRVAVASSLLLCLLAAAGISKPGRAKLGGLYSLLSGIPVTPAAADAEGRAKEKHGWERPPRTSVTSGTITYFDPAGAILKRGQIRVYRVYPDNIRVEIEHQGIVQVQGFDGNETWQARADNLSELQAREIRAWLHTSPEQLFLARGRGRMYRELGRLIEDSRPLRPVRSPSDDKPKELEQVELQDEIVSGGGNRASTTDKRSIIYLIDQKEQRVYAAQWLEADDPAESEVEGASRRAIRVDFENWRRVEGLLWPGQITRWSGGRLDWQIEVKEIQVNRGLPDTLFQRP